MLSRCLRPCLRPLILLLLALSGPTAWAACEMSGNLGDPGRGEEISTVKLGDFPRSSLDAIAREMGLSTLAGAARCDVVLGRMRYTTVTPDGKTGHNASAGVLAPVGGPQCPATMPVVIWSHGTQLERDRSLADILHAETRMLAVVLAAQGYAVVAPDFLGYAGSSLAWHPYLQPAPAVSAGVDAGYAAWRMLSRFGFALSGKLMLAGFSEGGNASMAMQDAIECGKVPGVRLTAAAHIAGPYDMNEAVEHVLDALPMGTEGAMVFEPFLVTGLQATGPAIYSRASDYFRTPYDAAIDTIFPGTRSPQVLLRDGFLPNALGDLMTDRHLKELSNPDSTLRKRIAAISVDGFTPQAPTLLCGGRRDPVVPFALAEHTFDRFTRAGAPDVTLLDLETVPALKNLFPATLSDAGRSNYHGLTVLQHCLVQLRNRLFDRHR